MTNRQVTKTFGPYTLSSQFQSGNAFDFKESRSPKTFEIYPAGDCQGFSYLYIFSFLF